MTKLEQKITISYLQTAKNLSIKFIARIKTSGVLGQTSYSQQTSNIHLATICRMWGFTSTWTYLK